MNRISALNSWISSDSDDDDSNDEEGGRATTKEAQEAEAFAKYNNALQLQKMGQLEEAREELESLLKLSLIQEVEAPDDEEEVKSPALILKYSTFKNLASIASQKQNTSEAVEHYLQAVVLDSSDVSVWYRIGCLALKLEKFPLARHAFEVGLQCNPDHWPCMDNVITLLYALNHYEVCLCYLARALERDSTYIKGLAFLKRIFKIQPSLQAASEKLFRNCDQQIYKDEEDKEEKEKYVNEALEIRKRYQELGKVAPIPDISLPLCLRAHTWKDLGEYILAHYDYVNHEVSNRTEYNFSKPPLGYCSKVDLSKAMVIVASASQAEPMEAESSVAPPTQPMIDSNMPLPSQTADTITQSSSEEMTGITEPSEELECATSEVAGVPQSSVADSEMSTIPGSVILPSSLTSQTTSVESSQTSEVQEHIDREVVPQTRAVAQPGDSGTVSQMLSSTGTISQQLDSTGTVSQQLHSSGTISQQLDSPGTVSQQLHSSGTISQQLKNTEDVSHEYSSVGTISQEFQSSGLSQEPRKRGPKRKRLVLEGDQDLFNKRRSARVRNACQRKEETVNYQEMLRKFLPQSLLECEEEMDLRLEPLDLSSYANQVRSSGAKSNSQLLPPTTPHLSENEGDEVRAWLLTQENNVGVVQLVHCYLRALAKRDHRKWTDGICGIYLQCYDRLRKHIILPNYLCESERGDDFQQMVHMILVWCELRLDRLISSQSKLSPQRVTTVSPRRSPVVNAVVSRDDTEPHFEEDMGYLLGLSMWRDVLGDDWQQFASRVSWMKGRYHVMENKKDMATTYFLRVSDFLKMDRDEGDPLVIHLVNCSADSCISTCEVEAQIESLQRCQSLEEVQRLYDSADYKAVIDTLIPTFARQPKGVSLSDAPDRHAQLILLQDALLGVSDYEGCLLWGEISFNEAFTQYLMAPGSADKDQWSSSIIQLFMGLNKCLLEKREAINSLPQQHLGRLVNNLLRLIDFCMDMPEGATEMAVSTVFPWILLYHLIEHEESKIRSSDGTSPEDLDECLPSAVLLLSVAHDCLGRRGWCTHSNGVLLHFAVTEMLKLLEKSADGAQHPFHNDLTTMIDQCYYCLYNHPSRRTKVKHLVDHGAIQVPLTWEHAQRLFHYFKPKSMPEYDSYKTSTVSAELEGLLRRISILIPSRKDTPCSIEGLSAYIEGSLSDLPEVSADAQKSMPVLDEIYYLLADYYFKNKEQAKAIKFYMHDLCINPTRFDAWAGMALARASRLEQRLNSHELKPEWASQKQSVSTLRCFQRALQLEASSTKLWIEYGSVAYQLHSHSSRTLKMKSLFALSAELVNQAEVNRDEMLSLAEKAYDMAGTVEGDEQEEQWLYHYILGKVAEKKKSLPQVYLQHYSKALECLYEDHAKYPKKITYYYMPPHLAVESLEVFYRIHVCIIKRLLQKPNEGDNSCDLDDSAVDLYLTFTKRAAESPFAKAQEKSGRRDSERTGADDSRVTQDSSRVTQDNTQSPSQTKSSQAGSSTLDTSQESVLCLDYSSPPRPTPSPPPLTVTSVTPHRPSVPDITGIIVDTPQAAAATEEHRADTSLSPTATRPSVSFSVQSILAGSTTPVSQAVPTNADTPAEEVAVVVSEVLSAGSDSRNETMKAKSSCKDREEGKMGVCDEGPLVESSSAEIVDILQKMAEKSIEADALAASSGVSVDLQDPQSQTSSVSGTTTSVTLTSVKMQETVLSPVKNESEKNDLQKSSEDSICQKDDQILDAQPSDKAGKIALIMERCVEAFKLCLSRFPQHYKSLYRLAFIYLNSPKHRNLGHCRDMLLGNRKWTDLKHMSSPGLFQDRKHTNFFNGLWRIPIEEIDRSGSFATHLSKAILLLFDLLRASCDGFMLLHVHNQLSRTPEQGKKYLRDCDRVLFSKMAFQYCIEAAETKVDSLKRRSASPDLQKKDDQVPAKQLHETVSKTSDGDNKNIAEDLSTSGTAQTSDTDVLDLSKTGASATADADAGCHGDEKADKGEKKSDEKDGDLKFLVHMYKVWQLAVRLSHETDKCNQLFREAYVAFRRGEVGMHGSVLEQAIQFCQQQAPLIKSTRVSKEKARGDSHQSNTSGAISTMERSRAPLSPGRSVPHSHVSNTSPVRSHGDMTPAELAALAMTSPNARSAAAVHSIYESMLRESVSHPMSSHSSVSPRSTAHSFYSKTPSYSPKMSGVKSGQIRKRSPYGRGFSQKSPSRTYVSPSSGTVRSPGVSRSSSLTAASPNSGASVSGQKGLNKPGQTGRKSGVSPRAKSPSLAASRTSSSGSHSSNPASLSVEDYTELMNTLGSMYLTPSQAVSMASAQAHTLAQWSNLAAMGAIDPSMWTSLTQSGAMSEIAAAQMMHLGSSLGSGLGAGTSGMLDYQMLLSAAAAESGLSSMAHSSQVLPASAGAPKLPSSTAHSGKSKLSTSSARSLTASRPSSGHTTSVKQSSYMTARPVSSQPAVTRVVSSTHVNQPSSSRSQSSSSDQPFSSYQASTSSARSSTSKAPLIQDLASKVSAGISKKVASGQPFISRPKPGIPQVTSGVQRSGVGRPPVMSRPHQTVTSQQGQSKTSQPAAATEVIDISCLSDDD